MLVRLASTVSQGLEFTVPLMTDAPREFDFEPQIGDQIAVGWHGLWTVGVTARRVGLDGVLIVDGTFEQHERQKERRPLAPLIRDGWMPDLIAANPEYLPHFLPAEGDPDPIAMMTHVAKKLNEIAQHLTDLPRGLDAAIRDWGGQRGVIEAAQ